MTKRLMALLLVLVTQCPAQDGLVIQVRGKQPLPADARRIYSSACEAVRREFGTSQMPSPKVTLVLDADKDELRWDKAEIRLKRWNRYLFAQGVVLLSFDELMTSERKMMLVRRAVNWAEATVDATQLAK